MEYLTEEERIRLDNNNDKLKLKKQIKENQQKDIEDLVDKIDLIKDTLIFPSPSAIAARVIEQMTGSSPEDLVIRHGIGTMVKRNIGRKGLKRFGESIFDRSKRGKVESLSGLNLFQDNKNKSNTMLILAIGAGLAFLRYAFKSNKKEK